MNRKKVFLSAFIIVVIIKVGLLYPVRQSAKEVIEMADKFENQKQRLDSFRSFYDSLVGNGNFRNRLLDTVRTVAELRQVQQNNRDELEKGKEEFRRIHVDRDSVIMKYKILDGVSNLISVLLVCMAIPLLIHAFKKQ